MPNPKKGTLDYYFWGAKISAANKGRKFTDSHKKKIGDAQRGELGNMFGKHQSESARSKMSATRKGVPKSIEHRLKISESNKKTMSDPEFRKRLSERQTGCKSHRWKGGITFEPYCPKFNPEFRERVRAFFNYQCIECGAPQNDTRLSVHHVNFNKNTCCDNSLPLFAPLCRSCHSKTQSNRAFWQDWFTEIINEFYGGKCYMPKKRGDESGAHAGDLDRGPQPLGVR
jgi:hypothetical protein